MSLIQTDFRSLTFADSRLLLQLGHEAAEFLSALPKRKAMALRAVLVYRVEGLLKSHRRAVAPLGSATDQAVQSIAERLVEVLRVIDPQQHPLIWTRFAAAVRDRQELDEFVAEFACWLRDGSPPEH